MDMKQNRYFFQTLLLSALLLAASCPSAFAHKVRIFAWEEGNTIHTESKFSGGRAARNAKVFVLEGVDGKQLLTGVTNEKGLFSFALPKTEATELNILVDSGDGHKNSWIYQITPATKTQKTAKKQQAVVPTTSKSTVNTEVLTKAELELVFERVLEEKLAPIRRSLAETQNTGPSIQDILGGIGYILGLAGIAAYFKSLLKNK